MFALGAGQIDPTAGHAICNNSLGHHQTCLHNTRKLPYDHLVLAILTCNYRIVYVQIHRVLHLLFPDWCHALAFLQVGSKRSLHMFKAQASQLGIFMPRALQGLPMKFA